MRVIEFDRTQDVPVVSVKLKGRRGTRKARLILDTGCALTQLDTPLIETLGYSASDGERRIQVRGAVGEAQEGYQLRIATLSLFGFRFNNVSVGAVDFTGLDAEQIDGLLGWDLIKQLHIEMDGPKGKLTVYSRKRIRSIKTSRSS